MDLSLVISARGRKDPKPTVTPKFSLSVINTKNKARTLYSTTF